MSIAGTLPQVPNFFATPSPGHPARQHRPRQHLSATPSLSAPDATSRRVPAMRTLLPVAALVSVACLFANSTGADDRRPNPSWKALPLVKEGEVAPEWV